MAKTMDVADIALMKCERMEEIVRAQKKAQQKKSNKDLDAADVALLGCERLERYHKAHQN